jgi:tetratricopeptide (TPR) repeat protein
MACKRTVNRHFFTFFLFLATVPLFCGCAANSSALDTTRQHAAVLYQQGKYSQAIQELQTIVSQVPKDSELWFRLGNAYAKNQQPNMAIESYRNALLRNPEHGKAWYNLGVIHMQEALKAFIDMEKHTNSHDPARINARAKRDGLLLLLGGQDENNEDKAP